ncbi:hypothetical protein R3P38DRAFT_3251580 [Favolaschia claudopus]|uniref:Uncharacterized protein n=1 Tax=Favolaschia claudopus TaxID=2862362 RepID=A0AAW0EDK9_9AGAR
MLRVTSMVLINLKILNQLESFPGVCIPALCSLPGLALLILVMKRWRASPSPRTDPEEQRQIAFDGHDEGDASEKGSRAPSTKGVAQDKGKGKAERITRNNIVKQAPSRSKRRKAKAIPKDMKHMKKYLSIWGNRWLPALPPSTAGSQQGELHADGAYVVVTGSPPPAYRDLSPVVVEAMPSSAANTLSSDSSFLHSFPSPASQDVALHETCLFGGSTSSFAAPSHAEATSPSHIYPAEPFPCSSSPYTTHSHSLTPSFFAGTSVSADYTTTSSGTYMLYPQGYHGIPAPGVLPVNNVPSVSGFTVQSMAAVERPSTSVMATPMYTAGYTSPHIGPGMSSPGYYASVAGSPLALYAGQPFRFLPPTLSPLTHTSPASFSMDDYSPQSDVFGSNASGWEYSSELDRIRSSPISGHFLTSPTSVPSAGMPVYGARSSYTSHALPFYTPSPYNESHDPWTM